MRSSSILLTGLLLVAAPQAFAQTSRTAKQAVPKSTLLKDGAFRRNGVTMRLQAGQVSRLLAPLTLENGAVIRSNGIIISPDGTRQLLAEDHAVNMQGGIVLLQDDMLTARAIDQQAEAVLGATGETRFTMADAARAANKSEVSPRLTAKLLRTEQRLAMLQEMTSRLEQRVKIRSASTAPLDQQLSQIDRQLQQAAFSNGTSSDAPATDTPGVR